MIPSESPQHCKTRAAAFSSFLLSISCVELNALVYASILHASELCLKSCRLLSHSEKAVYRLSCHTKSSAREILSDNLQVAIRPTDVSKNNALAPRNTPLSKNRLQVWVEPKISVHNVAHFPTDVHGKKITYHWLLERNRPGFFPQCSLEIPVRNGGVQWTTHL